MPVGWERGTVQQTRGLNWNHNHTLKAVFKGAATTVGAQLHESALYADYQRLLEAGTKPNLAKVTLARKIAATALAMWKHKEVYDPAKYSKPKSWLVSTGVIAADRRTRRAVCDTLQRRVGFGGEHPWFAWTTTLRGLKSPRIGYAPPENRMKPWPKEAAMRVCSHRARSGARRSARAAHPSQTLLREARLS